MPVDDDDLERVARRYWLDRVTMDVVARESRYVTGRTVAGGAGAPARARREESPGSTGQAAR